MIGRKTSKQSNNSFVGIGSKPQDFLLDAQTRSCTSSWDRELNLKSRESISMSLESQSVEACCLSWLSRSKWIWSIFLMKNIPISLANFCLSSCSGKTGLPVMFKSFLLTLNRCFFIVAIFCYESTIIDLPSLIHKKSLTLKNSQIRLTFGRSPFSLCFSTLTLSFYDISAHTRSAWTSQHSFWCHRCMMIQNGVHTVVIQLHNFITILWSNVAQITTSN